MRETPRVVIVGVFALVLAALAYESTVEAQAPQAQPIPLAGPLASPKSMKQVGVPVEATRAAVPADNPQTPGKIALGEKLFFDGLLSVDGTVACSTCHDPALAFTDGRTVSIGVKGRAGQRNSPTIFNALYNIEQFWDGRAKTLEEQAALPIVNPNEMGQPSMDAAVARIAAVPEYQQEFQRVFGRAINGGDLVRAIASYERTQFSFDSPFDRFMAGDKNAIIVTLLNAAGSCSTRKLDVTNAMRLRSNNAIRPSLWIRTSIISASALFVTMSWRWLARRNRRSIRGRLSTWI